MPRLKGENRNGKKTYFLAVYENEPGTFSGTFADFGCVCDDGDTLEELIFNAGELLSFTVAYMVEHGQPLPEPSEEEVLKAKLSEEPFCLVPVSVHPQGETRADRFARA